jgi:hypothetical protein
VLAGAQYVVFDFWELLHLYLLTCNYVYTIKEKFEDTKEGVNHRTDNAMAKRKRTKEQTTIYKTYT